MEKKRVFLAFSNAADQEDLIYIKSLLKKYDVEIVQFENGNYNKEKMLDCDLVILIIPRQIINTDEVYIGRGQYDQIEYLDARDSIYDKTYLFLNHLSANKKLNPCLLDICNYEKNDVNDFKLKYGKARVLCISCGDEIDSFLRYKTNNTFDSIDHSSYGINNNEHLDNRNIKDWLL